MLTVLHELPPALLEVEPRNLLDVLDGPSLIHLPGRRDDVLMLSVLLHGNETTGFLAVQQMLRHYADRQLPRGLTLLIGNVAAAAEGMRRLDGQPDYNRIWLPGDLTEHAMARQVLDEMRQRQVFASIDVHNNTGLNPHYACVNRIEPHSLHLASMFSTTVVYFTRPAGVLTAAMADLAPSVVLECGQPGQQHGVDHAREFLDACLHLDHLPQRPAQEYHLFHTVATVKVPAGFSFSCDGNGDRDIHFTAELDHMNFRELPPATSLATTRAGSRVWLDVTDEQGNDVNDRFFSYERNQIRTRVPLMPSMLTRDERIVRQDCLCYLMERMPVPR
jgi:succinylglutamate desuccinylase